MTTFTGRSPSRQIKRKSGGIAGADRKDPVVSVGIIYSRERVMELESPEAYSATRAARDRELERERQERFERG
jgi:hypothetical protein